MSIQYLYSTGFQFHVTRPTLHATILSGQCIRHLPEQRTGHLVIISRRLLQTLYMQSQIITRQNASGPRAMVHILQQRVGRQLARRLKDTRSIQHPKLSTNRDAGKRTGRHPDKFKIDAVCWEQTQEPGGNIKTPSRACRRQVRQCLRLRVDSNDVRSSPVRGRSATNDYSNNWYNDNTVNVQRPGSGYTCSSTAPTLESRACRPLNLYKFIDIISRRTEAGHATDHEPAVAARQLPVRLLSRPEFCGSDVFGAAGGTKVLSNQTFIIFQR